MDEAFELCDEIGIMDQGELIAFGSPKDLLKQHFESTVIELPLETIEEAQLSAMFDETKPGEKYFEIIVKDLNSALGKLSEAGLDLSGMNIRQKNLEDLFIHLTGKDLRS
jgi:ABC-type multidrug transport system ATPase subunit